MESLVVGRCLSFLISSSVAKSSAAAVSTMKLHVFFMTALPRSKGDPSGEGTFFFGDGDLIGWIAGGRHFRNFGEEVWRSKILGSS